MTKLGILIGPKGRGSNMAAIARACAGGALRATVEAVVAPTDSSQGVQTARELGLNVAIVGTGDAYGQRLIRALAGVDYVCLAGYLRLLPVEVLHTFPDRVLNIHPAILPEFGGKGMYGLKVHEAVLAAGRKESGCTVHLVNEVYDDGRILLQRRCPVLPGDTPERLAARVLEQEHIAYVEALQKIVD